jgi:choline dehydrogenase-like flavoprotein
MTASGSISSHSDVLVIGAGPAGALASSLLAQEGFSIVCLEQGDWTRSSEFPGTRPEWELLEQKPWNVDPNLRKAPADYPIDASGADFTTSMYAGVGGTTIIYRAHWTRFMPSDFRVRTLDGVADDWPITYEDLQPYYEAIDQLIGVSGRGGDPAYPPGAAPPLPPHAMTPIGRRMAAGMNRLGWHWWPAANAIASRRHRHLNQCVRYGTCVSGCPNQSKASFDLVVWPDALQAGAELVTGARVREITVNAAGLATGAIYIDRDGREHRRTADVVILAANSIGNARLLLLSKSSQFPDGLANSTGLVGRRLMSHPSGFVIGMFDNEAAARGPYGQELHSFQFYDSDDSRGFVRGAKWGLLPTAGPFATGFGEIMRGESPHRRVMDQIGHSVQWGILTEDLPSLENRVVLHETLTDSDGLPGVRIIAHDDDNVKRNLEFQIERATESFQAAGASKIVAGRGKPTEADGASKIPTGRGLPTRAHNMGTTMMGTDPKCSVVDQYCRSHDVPNLYIFGASVFPTGGGTNPTATLCAVTARAIEHIASNRQLQRIPVA